MRIRATLRLRNDHMIAARKALGLTQIQTAKICDVSLPVYAQIEAMVYKHPDAAQIADRIAGALNLEPREVAPPELLGTSVPTTFVRIAEMAPENLLAMEDRIVSSLPGPLENVEAAETADRIRDVLDTLTYREQEIVKLRYGLGDDRQAYTLEEVGRIFKVTRDRVRQVEMKALRKMSDGMRRDLLQEVVDGTAVPKTRLAYDLEEGP
jgi:RNA polymerase sigma factor (sigma-70 family)